MRQRTAWILIMSALALGCAAGGKTPPGKADSTRSRSDSTVLSDSSASKGAKPRGCFE